MAFKITVERIEMQMQQGQKIPRDPSRDLDELFEFVMLVIFKIILNYVFQVNLGFIDISSFSKKCNIHLSSFKQLRKIYFKYSTIAPPM